MNVLDLDFASLELRTLALGMQGDTKMQAIGRGRCRGKSQLDQMYMQKIYEDLVRQGKGVLVAHKAKLSHVTLDEIQQPMKRTEQPITLDGFSKSIVSVQVGTALAKTAGLY